MLPEPVCASRDAFASEGIRSVLLGGADAPLLLAPFTYLGPRDQLLPIAQGAVVSSRLVRLDSHAHWDKAVNEFRRSFPSCATWAQNLFLGVFSHCPFLSSPKGTRDMGHGDSPTFTLIIFYQIIFIMSRVARV